MTGKMGEILHAIQVDGRFKIINLMMVRLSKPQAEEFLEVYKGVLPYYEVSALLIKLSFYKTLSF